MWDISWSRLPLWSTARGSIRIELTFFEKTVVVHYKLLLQTLFRTLFCKFFNSHKILRVDLRLGWIRQLFIALVKGMYRHLILWCLSSNFSFGWCLLLRRYCMLLRCLHWLFGHQLLFRWIFIYFKYSAAEVERVDFHRAKLAWTVQSSDAHRVSVGLRTFRVALVNHIKSLCF